MVQTLRVQALLAITAVTIPSNADGLVDLEELKKHVNSNTAALMLTNPNTLGLFEKEIAEIAEVVHEAGGLFTMMVPIQCDYGKMYSWRHGL